MIGLDISEHNGYIDFTKLKREKPEIEFLIIRIGWIGNKNNHTLDTYFEDYYKRAKENGYKIGFYVYNYCNNLSAMQNACDWILHKIKGKPIEMPIFLDMEDSSIISSGKSMLTTMSKYFCNFFRNYGYDSGVYANKNWFTNYLDINSLLDYKIWLAEWNNKITFKYKVDLWQYTSKGKISGIKGNVDISKCLCECTEENNSNIESGDFEVAKVYKNGSTIEKVFADTNLTKEIGSLDKYEQCECLGIQNNRYIVKYKVNKTNNYKVGFVKYSGGVK